MTNGQQRISGGRSHGVADERLELTCWRSRDRRSQLVGMQDTQNEIAQQLLNLVWVQRGVCLACFMFQGNISSYGQEKKMLEILGISLMITYRHPYGSS